MCVFWGGVLSLLHFAVSKNIFLCLLLFTRHAAKNETDLARRRQQVKTKLRPFELTLVPISSFNFKLLQFVT